MEYIMLKIKDGIDLKALEMFGLKPHYRMENEEKGTVFIDYYYSTKYEPRHGYMRIRPKRKILWLWLRMSTTLIIGVHLVF